MRTKFILHIITSVLYFSFFIELVSRVLLQDLAQKMTRDGTEASAAAGTKKKYRKISIWTVISVLLWEQNNTQLWSVWGHWSFHFLVFLFSLLARLSFLASLMKSKIEEQTLFATTSETWTAASYLLSFLPSCQTRVWPSSVNLNRIKRYIFHEPYQHSNHTRCRRPMRIICQWDVSFSLTPGSRIVYQESTLERV